MAADTAPKPDSEFLASRGATLNTLRGYFLSGFLGRATLMFAVLLVLGAAAGAAAAQSIAVPAYFYAGGNPNYWTQIDQAGQGALAVLNPNSGPGSAPDPNYVSAVRPQRPLESPWWAMSTRATEVVH